MCERIQLSHQQTCCAHPRHEADPTAKRTSVLASDDPQQACALSVSTTLVNAHSSIPNAVASVCVPARELGSLQLVFLSPFSSVCWYSPNFHTTHWALEPPTATAEQSKQPNQGGQHGDRDLKPLLTLCLSHTARARGPTIIDEFYEID